MTFAKCFLGCTDVRIGVRIISIVDFWISVLLLIKCLMLLNLFYDDYFYYDTRAEQILYTLIIFSYLFLISMFLNVNYCLKESTYDHKVHKIYHWLAFNTIFLVFHILSVTYILIKNYYPIILYYSIPLCIIHMCQIYVVKTFYNDELLIITQQLPTASTVERQSNMAVVNQNSSDGSVNITLSASPAPNPIGQTQSAPPLQERQEARQPSYNGAAIPIPVANPIYPQLYYGHFGHDCTEPHFQNSMSMQAGPSSAEMQYPQEYNNPPAYSSPYNQQSEIHSVRKI
ncbi:uncharacterized protein LOC112604073 [Melanaphis sacchari]|uniref:uncharacterized protein LOC112604073 n=1 Tax=Melanaphis sacchari TaxID=742174 RepID=UPI000DC12EFF|nr:uncharacterized protein LOC112604073 [Melanaphis sacchari]